MTWKAVFVETATAVFTATVAQATAPAYVSNFSSQTITSASWTTSTTAPAVVPSGGQQWLQINPADNVAEYAQHAISGTPSTYTAGLALRINSPPSTGEVELLAFLGTGSKQIILTLGSDRRLRMHFKDLARECSSNGQYPYSSCTVNSDCPVISGGFSGESSCEAATYTQSDALTLNTTYRVGVSSTPAGTAIVLGSLFVDGIPRGSHERWEGRCAGGTNSGRACGENTDCPGSTCATSDISALTAIRYGTDSTSHKAFDVLITDVALTPAVDESGAYYYRTTFVAPDRFANGPFAEWTENGCSSGQHAACLDEAAPNDGDTTHLSTTASGKREVLLLDDPPSLSAGESYLGATLIAIMRNNGSSGTDTLGFQDTGAGSTNASVTVDGSSTYRLIEGPTIGSMPTGGGALVPADLRGAVTTTNGITQRMTAMSAELMIALPAPVLPTVFPDINLDGEDTVCVAGDSTVNDTNIFNAFNAIAVEPDNVLRCAVGGRQIGDVANAWSNIMDGSASGPMPCVVERGHNKPCDVVFLQIGVNDLKGLDQQNTTGYCMQRGCTGGSNNAHACKTSGDCPGGTCTDRHGPQNGGTCEIASGTDADVGATVTTFDFCGMGDRIQACCAGFGCGMCVGGSNNGANCQTSATCPGGTCRIGYCQAGARGCNGGSNAHAVCTSDAGCPGGTCDPWFYAGAADTTDDVYGFGACMPGSITSQLCPMGLCLHQTATSYIGPLLDSLRLQAAARTCTGTSCAAGTAKVLLIPIAHHDPLQKGNPLPTSVLVNVCVAGSNHGNACTSDANCPSGACRAYAQTGEWTNALEPTRWWHNYVRAMATKFNLPWIDSGWYMRRLDGPNGNAHLRDQIHLSDDGETELGTLLAACVERDTSLEENHCGDLTVGSRILPVSIPRLDWTTAHTFINTLFVAQDLGAPTVARQVDAMVLHNANPTGQVQCSVYARSGFTFTERNAACRSGVVDLTGEWQRLPTTTPASCTLSPGVVAYMGCITSTTTTMTEAVTYSAPISWQNGGASYASAPYTTITLTGVGNPGHFPWYLQVE